MNDAASNQGGSTNTKTKKGGGAPDIMMRRPQGANNTMEYRLDYVVSNLCPQP